MDINFIKNRDLAQFISLKFILRISKLFLIVIPIYLFIIFPLTPLKNPLKEIQHNNQIIMGTINSTLTYKRDGDAHSGFDYELAMLFSDSLNVELMVKEYDSLTDLFIAIDKHEVDFIGAGLTLTPNRDRKYRSSPPYYHASQKLVYRKGSYQPRNIADINAPIYVLEHSGHEETLQSLHAQNPNIEIKTLKNENQKMLLEKIANKEIQFAIVDSSTLAQKQRYYPELAEAFIVAKEKPVVWLIARNQHKNLYTKIRKFINSKKKDQTITRLKEKYFGHIEHFDYVDTRVFLKRINNKLPKYKALFKKYESEEVNWKLLAAVSYQESHWNPDAKSPTGVRGMMMLTRGTANDLHIEDRKDAEQSIRGGAKYLSQLIKRLPKKINQSEKIWFALASYNLGYGHVMDVRRITKMKKQNPNSWSDVKNNLPLLHQKKWHEKTRYGYARGKEAQHYVSNIRQYLQTLNWVIFTNRDEFQVEDK